MSRFFALLPLVALVAAAPTPAPSAKLAPLASGTAKTAVQPAETAIATAINAQQFVARGDKAATRRMLIRAQVLLDRAHFSPGVIDGKAGGNLTLALRGFQAARGLTVTGKLDQATFDKLTADTEPVLRAYTLVDGDTAGPFAEPVEPGNYVQMSERPNMTWTSALEWLAERAHMDETLVTALNPGVALKTGATIVVANTARAALPTVARIVVDKTQNQLFAYDAANKLVAAYPATVGSQERPAPDGEWAVRTVATAPDFTFDPTRLTYKPEGGDLPEGKKLKIKPGPNNPVGGTWIDLTKDTYGIHGSPDARLVGKRASNGCVRLTNWDAKDLAAAVKAGTKVVFGGVETRATT